MCAINISNNFNSIAFKEKVVLPKIRTFYFYISFKFLHPFFCKLPLHPQKFRYFADQNGGKEDPMKINFGNFQIQKWISQTVKAQKLDEKNARNLNILKQFISIHLKDFVIIFQKIVLFIGVRDINSSRDIKE